VTLRPYRASAWDESGVFVMNEKEKDRLPGLFLCLKFSTYRIFSGKEKIPTGNRNFWEKAIFIGYRWKKGERRQPLRPLEGKRATKWRRGAGG
jgi:hypothetical protein